LGWNQAARQPDGGNRRRPDRLDLQPCLCRTAGPPCGKRLPIPGFHPFAIWRPGCRNRRQRENLTFSRRNAGACIFRCAYSRAKGHDVMEATVEALDTIGGFLASRGTGSYLATTVTAPLDATLRSLSGLAKLLARPAVAGQARPSAFIWKARFFRTPSAGCNQQNTCWRPTLPPSTDFSRPPRAISA